MRRRGRICGSAPGVFVSCAGGCGGCTVYRETGSLGVTVQARAAKAAEEEPACLPIYARYGFVPALGESLSITIHSPVFASRVK